MIPNASSALLFFIPLGTHPGVRFNRPWQSGAKVFRDGSFLRGPLCSIPLGAFGSEEWLARRTALKFHK
eukprot:6474075-Amphidinium_carterae.1